MTSFFVDPDNHLKRFFGTYGGRFQTVKLFRDVVIPSSLELAHALKASESTLEGLEVTQKSLNTFTAVGSFVQVFNGAVPRLVQNVNKASDAKRRLERFSALCLVGKEATFIAGFACARPAGICRDYFGVRLGSVGKPIAGSFPYLMCANHLCQVGHYTSELILLNESGGDKGEVLLGLSEMALELAHDVPNLLKIKLPFWVKLPLNLSICGIGLFKAWRDSA